jgi:dCTP deaminase
MILGYRDIIAGIESGKIVADGVDRENIGANSIDVTLGDKLFEVCTNSFSRAYDCIDMQNPAVLLDVNMQNGEWLLRPGRLYLGTTAETVGSDYYVPIMHGRSTPARSGFSPIVSAGYGDVGFIGKWTLEITTHAHPVVIRPGDRIAQIEFQEVTDNSRLYSAKGGKSGTYAGQDGVRAGKEGNL